MRRGAGLGGGPARGAAAARGRGARRDVHVACLSLAGNHAVKLVADDVGYGDLAPSSPLVRRRDSTLRAFGPPSLTALVQALDESCLLLRGARVRDSRSDRAASLQSSTLSLALPPAPREGEYNLEELVTERVKATKRGVESTKSVIQASTLAKRTKKLAAVAKKLGLVSEEAGDANPAFVTSVFKPPGSQSAKPKPKEMAA